MSDSRTPSFHRSLVSIPAEAMQTRARTVKPGWRENVTVLISVIGASVAVFGVYKFFDDQHRARQLEARQQALSYVERYGSADLRAQRRELFDFWLSNSDVVAYINQEGASESAYRSFLITALDNHPRKRELVGALYAVSSFYDQVSFCREAELCDDTIIRAYFCPAATDFVRAYAPLSEALGEMSGATDFGQGGIRIAQACAAPR